MSKKTFSDKPWIKYFSKVYRISEIYFQSKALNLMLHTTIFHILYDGIIIKIGFRIDLDKNLNFLKCWFNSKSLISIWHKKIMVPLWKLAQRAIVREKNNHTMVYSNQLLSMMRVYLSGPILWRIFKCASIVYIPIQFS